MKDRVEKTTDEVLRLWQAAAERDPGDLRTWIFLARLHQEVGQTDKADDAASRALNAATQPRDRSAALNTLGDVQVAAGDLAAARTSFEDSHQVRTRLAAANPSSAEAQRDVAVSLWRLAQLPGGGVRWREVTGAWSAMEARGLLAPTDASFAAEARRRAAEEK